MWNNLAGCARNLNLVTVQLDVNAPVLHESYHATWTGSTLEGEEQSLWRAEIPGMVADPPPGVTLDPGFGESGLGFTVGFQIAEFANQFGVRHQLRKRILKRFRQEGIAIPFPARTVYMRSGRRAERDDRPG